MKVNVHDKPDKTTTSEMKGIPSGEIGHIAEMVTDPAKLADFGFDQNIVAKALALKEATEDNDPEFPVIRVEEGWSDSGRLYGAKEIDRIVDQTNLLEPVGHLGHIPDDEIATSLPEPQTTWIGALAKTEKSEDKARVGEQVRVAYFVGYNLPGAKVRGYIKSKAVNSISWFGNAYETIVPGRGVEVSEFDLKHIDWARKGQHGMPTARLVAIAREMKEGEMAELDLAQVTPAQFKEGNPNGYKLLVTEIEGEHKTTVSEMQTKVDEGEAAKSLLTKACELLGIDKPEELEQKITDLKTRIGDKAKITVKDGLALLLAEKVPGDDDDEDVKAKRALLSRLVPVSEMEAKVADAPDAEAAKKIISEMVDHAFDTDDTIKNVIGEQQPPVVRRREELRGGGGVDKALADYGVSRERVTLGS